jgi:hypothetical protein
MRSVPVVPHIPPKDIVFVILAGSYSHATGALEYGKVLQAKGHAIHWMHMTGDEWWVRDEEDQNDGHDGSNGGYHGFNLIDVGPYPPDLDMGQSFAKLCASDWTGISAIKEFVFDRVYSQSYESLSRHFANSKPDLFACDMFAAACIDFANKHHVPYVVLVDTSLGIFGSGELLDTPGFFTPYSHNWYEGPYISSLLKRMYNILLTTPQIIYHLGPVEGRLNTQRDKYEVSHQLTPMDKWIGHDIIFCSHHGWDWARPLPPYYHLVGPVFRTGASVSPLAPDLTQWLKSSIEPVIYVALGSRATMTPSQMKTVINGLITCRPGGNSTFSKYRILWISGHGGNQALPTHVNVRDKSVSLASLTDQVRVEPWISQIGLFSDNEINLAAFVSHAGISSIQEASHFGIPMLLMPFYGDQWSNTAKMMDTGAALGLDLKARPQTTGLEVCDMINKLATDPSIQRNVERMQLLSHLRGSGGSRGADIIERAAVVGVEHLVPYKERATSPAEKIIAHNIDVFAVLIGVLFVVILTLRAALHKIMRRSAKKKSA